MIQHHRHNLRGSICVEEVYTTEFHVEVHTSECPHTTPLFRVQQPPRRLLFSFSSTCRGRMTHSALRQKPCSTTTTEERSEVGEAPGCRPYKRRFPFIHRVM
ncbi:hypothetical protein BDN70DRAFT_413444 [Pholiota conissans]|uniref:Uncharacterized protein n=1 Tax=Pholiota conissans TaxID=109636 RepID=A0A9P5YQ89_9AGAR|nr:hypothetical protein BDN70DRAFT_413444 [Pholiota conissans]